MAFVLITVPSGKASVLFARNRTQASSVRRRPTGRSIIAAKRWPNTGSCKRCDANNAGGKRITLRTTTSRSACVAAITLTTFHTTTCDDCLNRGCWIFPAAPYFLLIFLARDWIRITPHECLSGIDFVPFPHPFLHFNANLFSFWRNLHGLVVELHGLRNLFEIGRCSFVM